MSRYNLNLLCPINSLSYGYVSLNIALALDALGVNLALWPIGPVDAHPSHHDLIRKWIYNSKNPDFYSPSLRIYHQFDLAQRVGSDKFIGFSFFEADELTDTELNHIYNCNQFLVSSKWAKEIVIDGAYRKYKSFEDFVDVIPLGIDPETFFLRRQPRSPTIFLMCGKMEIRKSHLETLNTFNQAFSEGDEVELWVVCENSFYTPEEMGKFKSYFDNCKLKHKVRWIPRQQNQHDLARLFNMADCLVSPSKAEGWNLPILEAMACGTHIITTNYSGHTEFCTSSNSFLIDIDEKEEMSDKCDALPDGKWFNSGVGKWARLGESQISQIINYMREVHDLKQNGKLDINHGGLETAKQLTWENTARKIMEAIF